MTHQSKRVVSSLFFFVSCISVVYLLVGYNDGRASKLGNVTNFIVNPKESNECSSERCVLTGNAYARKDLGALIEKCKLKTGLELGVQRGYYSAAILKQWKSCTKYYLVDPWTHQTEYKDGANVGQKAQEQNYEIAKRSVSEWKNKTVFFRLTTVQAAPKFEDGSLDFIYIDARHDYCAVKQDIELYWPKLRCGGIMAGHDYRPRGGRQSGKNNWDVCENGETHPGGPKRAVDEFVRKNQLKLAVTSDRTDDGFPSWAVMKIK